MNKITEKERDILTRMDGASQTLIKNSTKHIIPASVGQVKLSPSVRRDVNTNTLLHLYYSHSGSGIFSMENQTFSIKEGDFFIVPIGAKNFLQASAKESWDYRWVGFTGALSHDFLHFPTVFRLPDEITQRLYVYEYPNHVYNLASRLTSDLYLIHSVMQVPEENEPDYVQKVLNRIHTSYMDKVTVTQMAEDFNINRSHLTRIFKSKMNMSIQDYLLQYRLSEAKRYLKHNYSVSEAAQLCGFGDHANLYKVFLRVVGYSPTEWVKKIKKDPSQRPR